MHCRNRRFGLLRWIFFVERIPRKVLLFQLIVFFFSVRCHETLLYTVVGFGEEEEESFEQRVEYFSLLICFGKYYFFSGLRLLCMWNNKTMERKVHLNTLNEVSSFLARKSISNSLFNFFHTFHDEEAWKYFRSHKK